MTDILFLILLASIYLAPHLSKIVAAIFAAFYITTAFGLLVFEIYKRTIG
jgi:hypothetical protein